MTSEDDEAHLYNLSPGQIETHHDVQVITEVEVHVDENIIVDQHRRFISETVVHVEEQQQ